MVTVFGVDQPDGYPHFRDQLRALGCAAVASFGHLYWAHPDVFLPYMALDLPDKVLRAAAGVRAAYDLLADGPSRAEFVGQVRWRLHLDFGGLGAPVVCPDYLPPDLVRPGPGEVFVDCGAYTGDTIAVLLGATGGRVGRVVAFEADPVNVAALRAYVGGLPADLRGRIEVRPQAVGAAPGTVRIEPTGTKLSAVGAAGAVAVACVTLDAALAGVAPTFVKMDIEGAELDALAGAAGTIRRCRPTLAVCAYHVQDHLWRVPLAIAAADPTLRLFVRPHGYNTFDLVCYALPAAPPG